MPWTQRLILFLSCICLAAAAQQARAGATYTNPVIADEDLADPTVIQVDGTYYMYPTGGFEHGPSDRGYYVYTSRDLVHWTKGPQVFKDDRRNIWAPDVYRHPEDGKFYLYYTARTRIGVAVADGPEGPFIDKGLLVEGGSAIDAHLFRDDDGKLFLYYTRFPGFRMHVQPMASPLEKQGEDKEIFRPEQPWEIRPGVVNEGPWMIKHNGKYYLLYSGAGADWPDYAVGYAVADSPTGPFKKYEGNPIVKRGPGIYGPGHGCVVKDGAGKMWHVYHQKVDDGHNFTRFVCIDPIWFDEKGNLQSRTTRGTPQPAPSFPK